MRSSNQDKLDLGDLPIYVFHAVRIDSLSLVYRRYNMTMMCQGFIPVTTTDLED
jgi:hypothetical protein